MKAIERKEFDRVKCRQSCEDVEITEALFPWFLRLPSPSWFAPTPHGVAKRYSQLTKAQWFEGACVRCTPHYTVCCPACCPQPSPYLALESCQKLSQRPAPAGQDFSHRRTNVGENWLHICVMCQGMSATDNSWTTLGRTRLQRRRLDGCITTDKSCFGPHCVQCASKETATGTTNFSEKQPPPYD